MPISFTYIYKIGFISKNSFVVQKSWKGGIESSLMPLTQFTLLVTSHTGMVHLLGLANQYLYIIIN